MKRSYTDAISMPNNSLLKRLIRDYPAITFQLGASFKWSARNQVLLYHLDSKNATSLLLHELAHAILGHDAYKLDIELVKIERLAWQYAKNTLAPRYEHVITDDDIEDALDSYRQWLHERSLCPDCHTSGLQTKNGTYRCLACRCHWRANDARLKALRRYRIVI